MRQQHPFYVPSKGRSHVEGMTIDILTKDCVGFHIVVEPQEESKYADKYGRERLIVLPENNKGLTSTRNFIRQHAIDSGAEYYWQMDDNIRGFMRANKNKKLYCHSLPAIVAMEEFVSRYENIGIAGPNYSFFWRTPTVPPFRLNTHVYSCCMYSTKLPPFRGPANEDVDICLQSITTGLCTVQFQAFLIDKMLTEAVKGGNTDKEYFGDNRLKNARWLERTWPHVVFVDRRFGRPHFKITDEWSRLRMPLRRKKGVAPEGVDNFGMRLRAKSEVASPSLRKMLDA